MEKKPLSLKDRILLDMKSARKAKNTILLQTLKLVYAECRNREIEQRTSHLEDAQVIALLKKQVKQYEESIEQFEKANRVESAQEQKERLRLIQSYLPKALSKEELKTLVEETILHLKATSTKDMGLVIKTAQSRAEGFTDNRLLAELVKERLQAL